MNEAVLAKRDLGRRRYERSQARLERLNTASRRTRNSDRRSAPRVGEGLPVVHVKQTLDPIAAPTKKWRGIMAFMNAMSAAAQKEEK